MLALAAVSLAVLMADAPAFQPVPGRDSGGFLYIGQQMLHGQKLYADLFDIKPPFIFLVNALGLWLGSGSAWGVWALESVSLVAAVLLGFSLLSSTISAIPAVFGMLAFVGNFLRLLLGGNFTEEYALPFQFLILLCVLPVDLEKPLKWRAFIAGAAWGVVFFFKQNFWGIGLAVALFLFIRGLAQWKKGRFWELVWYGGGFLVTCALVAGYFLAQGLLWNLWDATFLSNFAYITIAYTSRGDLINRTLAEIVTRGPWLASMPFVWLAFLQGAILAAAAFVKNSRLWPAWLTGSRRLVICLAGGILVMAASASADLMLGRSPVQIGLLQWVAIWFGFEVVVFGFSQWKDQAAAWIRSAASRAFSKRAAILAGVAALAFLLDLLSIGLSGKFFTHYFLMLFPTGAILWASLAGVFLAVRRAAWVRIGAGLAVAAAFVPMGLLPLANTANDYIVRGDVQHEAVATFVDANTRPGDQVLIWGGEPVINFLTGRTRPNRFVFMSQLFLAGYANSSLADEMLGDLQARPPELIIDSRDCTIPFINYQPGDCMVPAAYWNGVFNFIRQNYHRLADVGPEGWQVYQLK
jgi:hypothetical protein